MTNIDYPELQKSMEKAFEDKIYNDNKQKMRDNMRNWAGSHRNKDNDFIFDSMADKLYRESFELHRLKEGYTIIHFKSGDRYVMRKKGKITKWYKQ